MMIAFQQLDVPRAAGNDGKWTVMAAEDMFLVLLKSGELEYGPDYTPIDYQFDTELDAWFAAAYYYNQNNEAFPYGDALLNAADAYPLILDEESQPMDFIK